MNIGIIGGTGIMGEVLIKGMLSLNISKKLIFFSGRDPKKMQTVVWKYKIQSLVNYELVAKSDVIFVCVKPQEFKTWAPFGKSGKKKIVISIMAGIAVQRLRQVFPGCKIVRAMPNLGGQVGKSMTGWFTKDRFSVRKKTLIKKFLGSFGKEIQLKKEDDINKFTALIGSGPAYLYLLMQTIEEQAVAFGFTAEQGRKMVKQLIKGAFKYLKESDLSPGDLISKVASKGGTTEAALGYLKQKKWAGTFRKALEKAYERAQALSK